MQRIIIYIELSRNRQGRAPLEKEKEAYLYCRQMHKDANIFR